MWMTAIYAAATKETHETNALARSLLLLIVIKLCYSMNRMPRFWKCISSFTERSDDVSRGLNGPSYVLYMNTWRREPANWGDRGQWLPPNDRRKSSFLFCCFRRRRRSRKCNGLIQWPLLRALTLTYFSFSFENVSPVSVLVRPPHRTIVIIIINIISFYIVQWQCVLLARLRINIDCAQPQQPHHSVSQNEKKRKQSVEAFGNDRWIVSWPVRIRRA